MKKLTIASADRNRQEERLGMRSNIPRRDFLNGVALAIAGVALDGTTGATNGERYELSGKGGVSNSENYPTLRSGLRGQYPAAVQEFDGIQNNKFSLIAMGEPEPSEEYDLVIVGAGISGLSAAHFYRTALGTSQRILILDNHDDFGGHAKRNEFQHQGRSYVGFGGTWSIATPFPYSYTAKSLLKELGITTERYPEFVNRELEEQHGLGSAIFFDQEHFQEDRLVAGRGRLPWKTFLEKAPLSEAARKDLIRVYGRNPDYMAGMTLDEK